MHYRPPQSNFRGGHVPRVPRRIYAYGTVIEDSSRVSVVRWRNPEAEAAVAQGAVSRATEAV